MGGVFLLLVFFISSVHSQEDRASLEHWIVLGDWGSGDDNQVWSRSMLDIIHVSASLFPFLSFSLPFSSTYFFRSSCAIRFFSYRTMLHNLPRFSLLYFLPDSPKKRAVRDAIDKYTSRHNINTPLVLSVGDQIYPFGVSNESDSLLQSNFEAIYKDSSLGNSTFLMSLGEHTSPLL